MEQSPVKKKSPLLLQELQAILTLTYGVAVAIGMLFQYHKYAPFGINIFEYADVFDFLIAPFSDLKILIYTLICLIITAIAYTFDKFWMRKSPKTYHQSVFGLSKKSWFPYLQAVMMLTLMTQYLTMSAQRYGREIYDSIDNNPSINLRFSDNERTSATFIGKTNEVLFVKQGMKTKVIPLNSLVKEYEISPKPVD